MAVVQGIKTHTDKDQQAKILEMCGYSCAHYDLQKVRSLKSKAKDEKELLKLINEHIPCGTDTRKEHYPLKMHNVRMPTDTIRDFEEFKDRFYDYIGEKAIS